MTRFRLALTALASAVALAACGDDNNSDSTRLSIRLTDAPGDITAAVVTISEIYLQGEEGRTVLLDVPVTTNLITLANDFDELVTDAVVPQGTYSQLRFVITGAYIDVEGEGIFATSADYEGLPDGAVVAGQLQTPSFSTSGLKVTLPGDQLVLDTDQKILLVDFDVSESFGKQAGGSGNWVMDPVIKGADFTVSGGVRASLTLGEGLTLPAGVTLDQVTATLNPGGEVLNLADGDANGSFEATFSYLLPGDYTVTFTPPGTVTTFTTDPASPIAVTVVEGQTATAAATVTAIQ
ncbi:MAG TPA: DUF4382 domain-containing protein [Gemmatimonadales bacterium]|nr:DUF4382 domain-containing protein [Gemmatimonadales bacterium]